MYKPRFQYCFKHLRDQTPNHAVFLLFQLFRSKNVKFHAKDGSNQKRQKDESSSEAASEMHNPWLANHVYGLSGAQLQKSATGVTTASKNRKRFVTRTAPSHHTNGVYTRKMPGWLPVNGIRHPRMFYGNGPRYSPTSYGRIDHVPRE